MKVREIMTATPATCGPETSLEGVARSMVEHDCGMIPVIDGDGKPAGAVTDRDIVCRIVAKGRNPRELRARDVMSEPCVTIAPDAELAECARLLEQHKLRRVVVVDAGGRCCGIVAQADLARAAVEIAGEVVREVSEPMHAPAAIV